MAKRYVEYRAYGKPGYMGKIEAKTGNEAVQYVKENVIGVNKIAGVWHDDDEEREEARIGKLEKKIERISKA